jgi:hypothetical protein
LLRLRVTALEHRGLKQTAENSSPCSLERAVAVVPAAAGSTSSVRRDDVDEEVEEVGVVHGRGDVLPVHGAALAVRRRRSPSTASPASWLVSLLLPTYRTSIAGAISPIEMGGELAGAEGARCL